MKWITYCYTTYNMKLVVYIGSAEIMHGFPNYQHIQEMIARMSFTYYIPYLESISPALSVKYEDSIQFSCSVVSDSLLHHELQHTRPPCPSPTPGVYSNSCPSSRWCHPAISSSVIPFSSWPQSLPASGSFPMSQLFALGGQSVGVSASASVFPMNI